MTALLAGRSVEGRPIEAVRVGAGPTHALLFGAIHGDEPGAADLCRKWLARAQLPSLPGGVIVIPVANPDGLVRNHKDNVNGVDLNRNFDARSWQAEHKPGYFPGARPLSEPESRALAQLIAVEKPRVIVSVHQPFRCVNWDGPAEALAQAMSERCGYPAVASVGYPTPGSFGARYGVDLRLPVITLELPRPVDDDDWEPCVRALDYATMWQGP